MGLPMQWEAMISHPNSMEQLCTPLRRLVAQSWPMQKIVEWDFTVPHCISKAIHRTTFSSLGDCLRLAIGWVLAVGKSYKWLCLMVPTKVQLGGRAITSFRYKCGE